MNQKTLIKASLKDIVGSSFAGYLNVSYKTLVDNLGEPHDTTKEGEWQSGDGKTKAEWAFKVNNRKKGAAVITIYDYKDPRPAEKIDLWHVGSKGRADVEQFLNERFPKQSIEIGQKKILTK